LGRTRRKPLYASICSEKSIKWQDLDKTSQVVQNPATGAAAFGRAQGREMTKVLVLNGPNLNLLGTREPDRYGAETLQTVVQRLVQQAKAAGVELEAFQSNAEHELIERIHQAGRQGIAYIIINPAALTHTSIALRDALLGIAIPFIEVHISNVHAREPFRRHSYLSDIAAGVISGLGPLGYELALYAALRHAKRD
jgi:3-dehydroquinate dehydratase-2